jgi:hypothetical protein
MPLTAVQYALWGAGFASHAILAAVMLRRESWRRWPSLFSLAVYEMGLTITLFSISYRSDAYFYIFWIGAIARAFLGLWLVFDVIKAIPGIQYAPRELAIGFVSLATALAVGCAWIASSGGLHNFKLAMMACALARCISVLWGVFTISLFAAIGFCGFGWTPTPLRMASSFLILVIVSCADSYAMSIWPIKNWPAIDEVFNLCVIGIRLFWTRIMFLENCQSDAPQGTTTLPLPQIERGSGL